MNYCPWCGTAQAGAAARRPDAPFAAPVSPSAAAATARIDAAASAAPRVAPGGPVPPAPQGVRGGPDAAPGPRPPARQEVPRPPLAARPPSRAPIRLRWWFVALALLWALWLAVRPAAERVERRIDAAIALAHACKGAEAQAELIALRKTRATPRQLQRLQQALNDESARCTRRRLRGRDA